MNNLELSGVTKIYKEVVALDNVSVSLNEGIYGLLGHNGAGKTTLLNLLSSNLRPTNGSIKWCNQDVYQDQKGYCSHLGYMPQQQALPDYLSVENFMYYMASLKQIKRFEEKITVLLEDVNLTALRKRKIKSLSGGMKQRLLIAQALLNDPEVLLLDEPTAGLDPVERANFREIIARISKGKIVILATHVISDVEYIANELLLMKKGKILTQNTQENLLNTTTVYETYDTKEQLLAKDSKAKIVNMIRLKEGVKLRFISKLPFPNPVPANLDDVYIDWLG